MSFFPQGALAVALADMGQHDPNGHADSLLHRMRRPAPDGLEIAARLACGLPGFTVPSVLRQLYEREIDPLAWQMIFGHSWRVQGETLVASVGRERLALWFARADFRGELVPMLAPYCRIDELPERFTVWRGGRGSPAEVLERGTSWTVDRTVARWYAERRQSSVPHHGEPVVLRREAARAVVLARFHDEVLLEPGSYVVESVSDDELRVMADVVVGQVTAHVQSGGVTVEPWDKTTEQLIRDEAEALALWT